MRYKIFGFLAIAIITSLIVWFISAAYQHDKKWRCVSGHEEFYMQNVYDGNGNFVSCYPVYYFVCDYEVLRGSTEKE